MAGQGRALLRSAEALFPAFWILSLAFVNESLATLAVSGRREPSVAPISVSGIFLFIGVINGVHLAGAQTAIGSARSSVATGKIPFAAGTGHLIFQGLEIFCFAV